MTRSPDELAALGAQRRALPKVELHLHLEGAAPPSFIRGLAAEKSMDLSGIFAPDGSYAYRDFDHFLQVYDAACTTLTGPEEFYRLTRAVLEESASHGVIYTEAFLSPDFCGQGDVAAWRDYLAAIELAAGEMRAEAGIEMRAVITAIRHYGPAASKATALCAAETAGSFVTGFGIAGAENMGHFRDFLWAFDCAREAGLQITAHAGEWCGAAEVTAALDTLAPARIGHGIGAITVRALVDRLAELGTVLEVCPGSNVYLNAVPSWADHPIQRLRERGVAVTVSTDDPPYFHTTMTDEYVNLAQTFGWTGADFRAITDTALGAAFCDADTRADLQKRLDATDWTASL